MAPATITLTADAVDPDGEIARVEFFAGGQRAATYTGGTLHVELDQCSGGYIHADGGSLR